MVIAITVMQAFRPSIRLFVMGKGWEVLKVGYTGGSTEWTVVCECPEMDLEFIRAEVEESVGWCEVIEVTESTQLEFCGC